VIDLNSVDEYRTSLPRVEMKASQAADRRSETVGALNAQAVEAIRPTLL
jgi:hypothetical protein